MPYDINGDPIEDENPVAVAAVAIGSLLAIALICYVILDSIGGTL